MKILKRNLQFGVEQVTLVCFFPRKKIAINVQMELKILQNLGLLNKKGLILLVLLIPTLY